MSGAGKPGSCDRPRFPGCCRGAAAAADAGPAVRRCRARRLLAGLCRRAGSGQSAAAPPAPEYKGAAPAVQSHICIPLASLRATTGIQSAPLFPREVCATRGLGFIRCAAFSGGALEITFPMYKKRLGWSYCLKVTRRKNDLPLNTPITEDEAFSAGHGAHGRTIKENTTNTVTQSYTLKTSPENCAAEVRLTKKFCL